ncbi:MAG: 2-amino-4-hydroxy-6-hydroxymethyldihydropteridine diphosphokinase [Pseudomonadota bacterium]
MPNLVATRNETAAAALIALGANTASPVGGPQITLETALDRLRAEDLQVLRRSAWRSTRAEPPGAGPDFINGVALIETTLSASALLDRLHDVEEALGRPRRLRDQRRWRPRGVDLDLLALGDHVAPDEAAVRDWMAKSDAACLADAPTGLLLPHPRLHRRAFVLDPLMEVAPAWRHPLLGLTAAAMLSDLPEAMRAGVRLA